MRVLLLKFGELFLKGGNKKLFEKALVENIKNKLVGLDYDFVSTQGRYVIENYKEENEFELINRLSKVFGLIEISKAEEVESTQEAIESYVSSLRFPIDKTFRVSVNRADKKFPINSNDYSRVIGEIIFESNKGIKVDLYNFDIEVRVDIRFNKKTYVYYESVKCPGGLPYKTGGKGLLLLSGGIDSPVAGYMMAKRGMEIECLHFHSFPYTSKQAKEKVLTLAKELTDYCDTIKVHVISFTKIQEHIHMNCDSRFMITIMRRIMMRIAERICNQNGLGCIITGENLGQVASQTMESMTVTNDVVEKLPVFRPFVAFDKEGIIEIAKKIGTFETSILPYEDCCTVFLPKNPVIKPTVKQAEYEEKFLNIEDLIGQALQDEEIIVLNKEY